MFYLSISFIKFIFISKNEHGIHSPFVFNFVTKGLYQKKTIHKRFENAIILNDASKKEKKIVLKILNYFSTHTVTSKYSAFNNQNNIICYLKSPQNILIQKIDNTNSFLIISGPHKNRSSFLAWKTIIKNNVVTVSIDLFYIGLVFFRKEQAKEHFIIRV